MDSWFYALLSTMLFVVVAVPMVLAAYVGDGHDAGLRSRSLTRPQAGTTTCPRHLSPDAPTHLRFRNLRLRRLV